MPPWLSVLLAWGLVIVLAAGVVVALLALWKLWEEM